MSRSHEYLSFAGCEFGIPHRRARVDPAVLLDLIARIKTASDTPAVVRPNPTPRSQPIVRAG